MQETINPNSEIVLPDFVPPERENDTIMISSFPKSHPFFRSDPFWRIRITGYARSDNPDDPYKQA
jgi:hypothetical protein